MLHPVLLIFGGTRAYNVYEADLRKYIDLSFISDNNMSLCLRGVFAMTEGKDRPYFLVGGAGTLRGIGYREYKGDKIFLTSVELRYTMIRNLNLRLWPATFVLLKNIKAAFFNDSGIIKKGEIENLACEDVKSGSGMSLILDTFILQRQYMPLKFEVAKRTDIADNAWKFYFSVSTGF